MPEFGVQCVWCSGSFEAVADSMDELVRLVECHIDEMEHHPTPGHKRPPGGYPHGRKEILDSPMFSWIIFNLSPFNDLSKVCVLLGRRPPSRAGVLTSPLPRTRHMAKLRRRLRRREGIAIPVRS